MVIEGVQEVANNPAVVWEKLCDMQFLSMCIPDVEEVISLDQDTFVCQVIPSFSFAKGMIELTIRRGEAVPQQDVRLHIQSKAMGGGSDVQVDCHLEQKEGGTAICWKAEVVALQGLLRCVPRGLLQAAARKIVDETMRNAMAGLMKQAEVFPQQCGQP